MCTPSNTHLPARGGRKDQDNGGGFDRLPGLHDPALRLDDAQVSGDEGVGSRQSQGGDDGRLAPLLGLGRQVFDLAWANDGGLNGWMYQVWCIISMRKACVSVHSISKRNEYICEIIVGLVCSHWRNAVFVCVYYG